MHTVIEDDNMRIGFEPGDGASNKTVVSFTGVGFGFGAIQKEEFRRSLRSNGQVHDTYYVVDKDRKWYNTTGQKIASILRGRLSNRKFFTIGNSMGGFGALLFSTLVPGCEGVVAFCPQFSVNKSIIPAEHRFDK